MSKSSRLLSMCLVPLGMCLSQKAHAATLTVTNLNDSGSGSLRAQVAAAAAGDSIDFSVAGAITLTQGGLVIDKGLTISGPAGAPGITVSGNGASRIFTVSSGTVVLSRLTLSGGNGGGSDGSGRGGAIHNSGSLTVSSCTLSGNSAPSNGGGIYNAGGLTVDSSILSGNSGINGGAIYNAINASMTVKSSTLAGNSVNGGEGGGGIFNVGATTISSSTIAGNSAPGAFGGGINQANYVDSFTNLSNSILAGNTGFSGGSDDYRGVVSGDYNLVQNAGSQGNFGSNTITGQDPQLGALADNGGPTKTMALLSNSQAINAGDPGFDADVTPYDQRGEGYARKTGNAVDLGAVESAFTTRVPIAVNTSFTVTPNTYFSGALPASDRDSGDTLTYTILTGALPAGLTFDTATGIISGTTGGFAARTLTFKATDNHGADSNTATATLGAMEVDSLLVNTNSDAANNTDGLTSIREAVAYANSGNAGAAPVITFAANVTGAITLTSGVMAITRDLTITGPGAGSLVLKGINGDGARSIFNIGAGVVNISGLTLSGGTGTFFTFISGGESTSVRSGGALYITGGTVTVTNSILSDNLGGAGFGGATFMTGGGLAVANCTLARNANYYGGAICLRGSTVATITNSTLADNDATLGGAIFTMNSTDAITIRNCTLSGNDAQAGGGIFTNAGPVTLANSTLSANRATGTLNGRGGGIYVSGLNTGTTITNSTITKNGAQFGGGGIAGGPLNMSHTIVCGNSGPAPNVPANTTITGANNLIDQDAMLDVLADNGGPTKTHKPLAGSPALDAGDPNFDITNTPYEQRGPGFPRVLGGRVDIGAYEAERTQSGNSFVVNTLADGDDGAAGLSNCTLREAVKYLPAGGTITFNVTGAIILTQGEIAINKSLTITGPSISPGITVSGNGLSRIFGISGISNGAVNFNRLTLSGGNGTGAFNNGNGGAIYNTASTTTTVALTDCTFTGNSASISGGAIRNIGRLTATNSTFSGNSSASGGAIRNDTTLTVANSTFAGNSATSNGGGIYGSSNTSSLTLWNSTISGNSALNGGGIFLTGATPPAAINNSLLAGNTATTGPDISGVVKSGGYNLVGKSDGSSGIANGVNSNQAGTAQQPLDPKIGALADNGGPTKTMALLSGSPAIDAGDPNFDTTNTPYDQRGAGFARKSSSAIDIGAYEAPVPPDATPPTISISAPSLTLADASSTVTYTVTYADANFSSSTLSASNVTLDRAGTVDASVSVTSGSMTTRTVTLSGITGYGTLGISIVAGTAIDNSGNTAPAAGPSSTFTVNPSAEMVQSSGTIRAAEGGGFAIGYIGNPGQEYTIQFSPDLLPPWQTLGTQAASSSGIITIIDNPPPGTPQRFYRLLLP